MHKLKSDWSYSLVAIQPQGDVLINAKWEGKRSSREVLQVRLFQFGPEGRRPVNFQLSEV